MKIKVLINQNNVFLLDAFIHWSFASGIACLAVQIGLGNT